MPHKEPISLIASAVKSTKERKIYSCLLLMSAVMMSGCVAAWGDRYKLTPGPVENLTSGPGEKVLIEYDPVWIREEGVTAIADQYCKSKGKATKQARDEPCLDPQL